MAIIIWVFCIFVIMFDWIVQVNRSYNYILCETSSLEMYSAIFSHDIYQHIIVHFCSENDSYICPMVCCDSYFLTFTKYVQQLNAISLINGYSIL